MADRIVHYPSPGGTVGLYAIFRAKSDGDAWNGTANVPFVDANIATYDVALAFLGGDAYGLTVPVALPNNETYVVAIYRPATAVSAPATTDVKLPDEWEFRWNGSSASPVPAEPAPGQSLGYKQVLDVYGEPAEDVMHFLRVAAATSNNPGMAEMIESDADGMLNVNHAPETDYQYRRGNGEWTDYTSLAEGESFELPDIIGGEHE